MLTRAKRAKHDNFWIKFNFELSIMLIEKKFFKAIFIPFEATLFK